MFRVSEDHHSHGDPLLFSVARPLFLRISATVTTVPMAAIKDATGKKKTNAVNFEQCRRKVMEF
jgi:hypothetical protein